MTPYQISPQDNSRTSSPDVSVFFSDSAAAVASFLQMPGTGGETSPEVSITAPYPQNHGKK